MVVLTCQPERATQTRRKKLRKIWQSKEWKTKVKEFISDRPCQWCGSMEFRTAHHPYRSSYGEDIYLDLYLSQCMVLCRRCHTALHKGLKLCPTCKQKYAPYEAETCFPCYCEAYPEVKERVEKAKIQRKQKLKEARKAQSDKAKQWKKDHPLIKKKNGLS